MCVHKVNAIMLFPDSISNNDNNNEFWYHHHVVLVNRHLFLLSQ